MKTLLLIISIVIACTITAIGQNYIGMDQSKIIKRFGEPDEKGDNYFVYSNLIEEGTNIYYFDEDAKCVSFLIVRNNNYLNDYQKMLNKEFTKTCENKYLKKSKKINFLAEITKSAKKFQILVKSADNCAVICEEHHVSTTL
jgi:hypothetical protein